MSTVLRLSEQDWATSRFVTSPLWETFSAVRTLDVDPYGHRHRYHEGWLRRIGQSQVSDVCRHLIAASPPIGWVPDFLTPPPIRSRVDFETELDRVAATPTDLIGDDLQQALDSDPTPDRSRLLAPLIADPALALDVLTAEMRLAWQRLVEPYWPSMRQLLSDDVDWRSRQAAQHGLAAVVADLHPAVRCEGSQIIVGPAGVVGIDDGAGEGPAEDDKTIDVAGRGLLLMPSAFVWPDVVVIASAPWHPTLIYPARGLAELWQSPPPPPEALSRLLGRTRARLLSDLDAPAATSALAARHSLAPATVSAHLNRLRDAGLVTAARAGHEVRYVHTALGAALVEGRG